MTATGVDSATQTTRTSLADTYVRNDVQANNSSLSMDDFWKLLSAQLRYQDMSNPMSNSEMMGQLTQMATMNAMDTMGETITAAMNSMSQISLSSYATGLLGQEITVADLDKDGKLVGETTGKVDGVALSCVQFLVMTVLSAAGALMETPPPLELLGEETKRLGQQLSDGLKILSGGAQTVD